MQDNQRKKQATRFSYQGHTDLFDSNVQVCAAITVWSGKGEFLLPHGHSMRFSGCPLRSTCAYMYMYAYVFTWWFSCGSQLTPHAPAAGRRRGPARLGKERAGGHTVRTTARAVEPVAAAEGPREGVRVRPKRVTSKLIKDKQNRNERNH